MYKSKLHQGKKRNFGVLDVIEFIHRVCLHIPGHYEALIRYYGHYANAARGKRKKMDLACKPLLNIIADAPDRKTCRRSWARLIYQVYEVDPLKCPKCGARMKIIVFIQEREEIIRILTQHSWIRTLKWRTRSAPPGQESSSPWACTKGTTSWPTTCFLKSSRQAISFPRR